MNNKRRILNHHKRWNIELNEQKELEKLKHRLINKINLCFDASVLLNSKNIQISFANLCGDLIDVPKFTSDSVKNREFTETNIYIKLKNASTITELATALQYLFGAIEEYHDSKLITDLFEGVKEIIENYPGVGRGIEIARCGNSITIYPEGAELLDEGVVNDVLNWLEDYPTVAKSFEQALIIYTNGEKEKYRNLLDNLRFCLEQLLKKILDNNKSLENQKGVLLQWLNGKKLHQKIIDMFNDLIGHYSKYQNDAVKHNEDYSEHEIEFMIYLTGTFIRLLLKLAQS